MVAAARAVTVTGDAAAVVALFERRPANATLLPAANRTYNLSVQNLPPNLNPGWGGLGDWDACGNVGNATAPDQPRFPSGALVLGNVGGLMVLVEGYEVVVSESACPRTAGAAYPGAGLGPAYKYANGLVGRRRNITYVEITSYGAQRFEYTATPAGYTVPPTVVALTLTVAGATGGGAVNGYGNAPGSIASGTRNVTSGMLLHVFAGGAGGRTTGGWNGGGNGVTYGGGGGGGASDVRTNLTDLATRFIVGGGGGGAPGNGCTGGQGGGTVGGSGCPGDGFICKRADRGLGGNQTAGGHCKCGVNGNKASPRPPTREREREGVQVPALIARSL